MFFRIRYWLTAGLIATGIILVWFGSIRPVSVTIDGVSALVMTRAFTPGGVLHQLGYPVENQDRIIPNKNHLLRWHDAIELTSAVPVSVGIADTPYLHSSISAEKIPANLLFRAGIALFPGDEIIWNGLPVAFDNALPAVPSITLLYHKALPVQIQDGSSTFIEYSAAETIAGALWDAGYHLQQSDLSGLDVGEPLPAEIPVQITHGRQIIVEMSGKEWISRTSADTVGDALAQAGVALVGLDYSIPSDDSPVPADGRIKVVRVREEIELTQTTIPYSIEYVEDPDTELDQTSIVEPGVMGLKVSRVRVVYEDGVETSRTSEAEWTAVEPKAQKVGYGTKIVLRTIETPSGTIEYWRAITVLATSYSPCQSGTAGKCYYSTSSGLPVQRGVVGVTRAWYNLMAGQGVYIPGYGSAVIADVGGGIPGKDWIDLGFSDADFEPWYQTVTMYFKTPVPATVPWILP